MTLLHQVLALTAVLACTAAPADASERAPRTPAAVPAADPGADLDWRGTIGRGGALKVGTINGKVTVTRSAGKRVRVRGFKSGPDAADVKIEVKEDGDRVSVRTKYPQRSNTDAKVDFVVELPDGVELDADVVNGEVDVAGVEGPLRLASVNGPIKATGSGDVKASTVNGRVVVALPREATRATLDAVNGVVEVRLPAKLGAKLRASTVSGSIDSDFPLSRSSEFVGARASGTLGDGRATITLETVSGRIKIKKS